VFIGWCRGMYSSDVKEDVNSNHKQVVLITGASSGIGEACAYFLAERGFIVYAGSRTPEKIEKKHKNLYPIKLDLRDPIQIKDSIDALYKEQGQLNVVINNAGYGYISSVEDGDEEAMRNQFDINVFSIFRVCKVSIPYMKQHENSLIINIGSYFGKVALPMFAFYSASKFAVEGLTDALKFELKELNIRVHSIVPGFTKTNFTNANVLENMDTSTNHLLYKKALGSTAQLMKNINQGSSPRRVAQTVWETINNINADTRVYVEGQSHKVFPLRDELTDDEQMMYRFYMLEMADTSVNKDELKIAMDAKEILLKDFVNPPKIEYLAKCCGTNKTKINKVFQNIYKVTISNYIKKLRLEKANILLKEGTYSIGEVAKKVGYAHQGNFSKLFFEKYGLSPKEVLNQKC